MQILKRHWVFLLILGVFLLVAGALGCTWVAHQINPDATAYFTIAESYAHFDFKHALNGYWGPLFSWLLVPAVWLHIGLDIWARLVIVLAAGGILVLAYYTLLRYGQAGRLLASSVCLLLACVLFKWSLLDAISPDMVFAFGVIGFVLLLLRFLEQSSVRRGIGLGACGGLLYLTKGFGLYLFAAVTVVIALHQRRREKAWRPVLKRWVIVWATLAAIVLPFAAALSLKYNRPTINTTGAYVHRAFGPQTLGGQPMLSHGPLAPPNAHATTPWEDPTFLTPLMPDWSPLSSAANRSYFWHKIIWRNLEITLQALAANGAFVTAAVLVMLLGCFGRAHRREFVLLTLTALIMTGGYVLVLVEPRYLWGAMVLAVIAFGLWLQTLHAARVVTRLQILLGAAIVATLMLLPVGLPLQDARLSSQEMYTLSQGIAAHIPAGSHVIADNFMEYRDCYYARLHCYAVLEAPPSGQERVYLKQLKDNGIKYFINYHSRDADLRFMQFVQDNFEQTAEIRMQPKHPLTPVLVTLYQLR